MNIFDKRPLSMILCIMLGGFVFVCIAGTILKIIFTACILLTLFLLYIKPLRSLMKIGLLRVSLICLLLAVIFSHIYFDLWFKCYDRFEGESYIVGEITDMSTKGGTATLELKTDSINDAPLSKYNLMVYVDAAEYYGYSIGSKISFKGKIEAFKSKDNFDAHTYYTSRGFSGMVQYPSELVIHENGKSSFSQMITDYRQSVARRLIANTNAETGGLLAALLLGEKTYLSGEITLDFSRTGLSHVLALSGMHVSILILGLMRLLNRIGLDKRITALISIPLTVTYMLITGFPLSVVRAGLMLIISSLLFLLSRGRDSITTLSIAVFVICLFTPYAVLDISLWLSAFATLGIVSMSELSGVKRLPRLLKILLLPFISSLFALFSTMFISVSSYENISLVGILTTPLFSVPIEIFLYVGTLVLLFGNLLPIGRMLSYLGTFIIKALGAISDIDYLYVSTDSLLVKLIGICVSVGFILFLILRLRKKIVYISAIFLLFSFNLFSAAYITQTAQSKTEILYTCSDKSENLIMMSDGCCAVTDMSKHNVSSAYELIETLKDLKLSQLDTYIVTHYSNELSAAIETLAKKVKISTIILPSPQSTYEHDMYKIICADFKNRRTEIMTYSNNYYFKIGQIGYSTELLSYSDNGQSEMLFNLDYNEKRISLLTSDSLTGQNRVLALTTISDSHTLIVLRHKSSEQYRLTQKFDSLKRILYSERYLAIPNDILEYYGENIFYCDVESISLIH